MARAFLIVGIIISLLVAGGCESTPTQEQVALESCDSLQECLTALETAEVDRFGISESERTFAQSFTRFGEPALRELLLRLDIDGNRDKLVGYAISSFDPIDEIYLPQIVEGVKHDVSWLARSLGNIPTEKGAEAAVDAYLEARTSPGNQQRHAVIKQGKRAVPFILQRMACGEYCEGIRQDLLIFITGEMDSSVKAYMAGQLAELLERPDISRADQANLLGLFFNMGPEGLVAEKELEQLLEKYPKLSGEIERAYVGIRSKHSGIVFANWIKQNPDNLLLLRDVADMGPIAKEAGPELVNLLTSEFNEIRTAAARALGFLEYQPAERDLIQLFENPNNAQLSWVTANSLGRLGLKSSIPALEWVAEHHWYPAVQKEAALALQLIQQGSSDTNPQTDENFSSDFFEYEHLGVKSCKHIKLARMTTNTQQRLQSPKDWDALRALTYQSYIVGFKAADEDEQKAEDPDGVIEINQNNIVEVREDIHKTPGVAVRANDGWLTGYDGGEWGGELMYQPDFGEPVKLLNRNVDNLFKLGEAYIALTGLAHLSMNEGAVYRIVEDNGSWQVTPWVSLPGAPKDAWLATTGDVLIDTNYGGTIVLSETGTLRMAPCDGYEED